MAPGLVSLLRCPETRQPLSLASSELLARVNETCETALEAGLVREDGKLVYPIRNGIAALLADEGIAL